MPDDNRKFIGECKPPVQMRFEMQKDLDRVIAMYNLLSEAGRTFHATAPHAVVLMATGKAQDIVPGLVVGIVPDKPKGLHVCPTCLEDTIAVCKEMIGILQDIQKEADAFVAANDKSNKR